MLKTQGRTTDDGRLLAGEDGRPGDEHDEVDCCELVLFSDGRTLLVPPFASAESDNESLLKR